MVVHRSIATCLEEPGIDMSLDMRPTFTAQSQKTLLDTVPSNFDISAQQTHGISNQRTLKPLEGGVQPQSMLVAGWMRIACDSLGRCLVMLELQKSSSKSKCEKGKSESC
jgi:hypothetical protein